MTRWCSWIDTTCCGEENRMLPGHVPDEPDDRAQAGAAAVQTRRRTDFPGAVRREHALGGLVLSALFILFVLPTLVTLTDCRTH